MYINEDKPDSSYPITAYDDQSITVSGHILRKPFILLPSSLIADCEPQAFHDLTEHHLQQIIAAKPEVLLIGTGSVPKQLPGQLRYLLESNHIGVECMTTPAACRSYTVLLSEGRNMAALFFIER